MRRPAQKASKWGPQSPYHEAGRPAPYHGRRGSHQIAEGRRVGPVSGRSISYLAAVPVTKVKGLGGRRGEELAREGVSSVAHLLLHAPRRYIDRSRTLPVAELNVGEEVTVIGTIAKVSTRRPRKNLTMVEANLYDGTSYLRVTWFNQPFRARQLQEGVEVAVSGKVDRFRGALQMSNPVVDKLSGDSLVTGRVVPVHPAIGKVTAWQLRSAVHNALLRSRPVSDPIPEDIRARLELTDRDRALQDIHFPDSLDDVEAARRRLVFDELFRLELALAMTKQRFAHEASGIAHEPSGRLTDPFVGGLPFVLTEAQQAAADEIRRDLVAPDPMHRLLQGEVGSGKTVVAVLALLAGVEGGYQGAVMAPTEVLAEQHYLAIRHLLHSAGLSPPTGSLFDRQNSERAVTLALLTSNRAELNTQPLGSAGREEVLELIRKAGVDIVVGTHALIQEGVHFPRLGVAVVDEQHRFGVHQRIKLKEKAQDRDPDLLIMTATPIPRTLAMTLYGDLDVTLLDQMPPGRSPVETLLMSWDDLDEVYDLIRLQARRGHQTFVVCPLVEDSAKIEAASATASYERLRHQLPDLRVGLVHGQMRPGEKEHAMDAMRAGDLDVLVATTVIEVGVDVPNATLMVVEDAQRFGLSQLHQLRGRVGRGAAKSTCLLIADVTTEESIARLQAMVSIADGFELAEEDLRIRGQGTVFGARQSGASDLNLADLIRDAPLLVVARREAFDLVREDPGLREHGALAEEVRALLGDQVGWLSIS